MLIAMLQCVSAANRSQAPSHDKYKLLNTMPNLLMTTELSINAKMPGYSTEREDSLIKNSRTQNLRFSAQSNPPYARWMTPERNNLATNLDTTLSEMI